MRYLPEFESRTFVKSTQNQIQMEMESNDLFTMDNSEEDEEEYSWGNLFNSVLDGFLTGYTFGGWALAKNAYNHSEMKNQALNWVNSISGNFDPDPYLQSAFSSKDMVIEFVKDKFITELIEPLQEQIKEIREKKDNKEKELQDAKQRRDELEISKTTIAKQFSYLSELKASLV